MFQVFKISETMHFQRNRRYPICFNIFQEKKLRKKFEKFSTNQIVPFWNFEFGAKKGVKWKLMIHWFQNYLWIWNRSRTSRVIAVSKIEISGFLKIFDEKLIFHVTHGCQPAKNTTKWKPVQNYIKFILVEVNRFKITWLKM